MWSVYCVCELRRNRLQCYEMTLNRFLLEWLWWISHAVNAPITSYSKGLMLWNRFWRWKAEKFLKHLPYLFSFYSIFSICGSKALRLDDAWKPFKTKKVQKVLVFGAFTVWCAIMIGKVWRGVWFATFFSFSCKYCYVWIIYLPCFQGMNLFIETYFLRTMIMKTDFILQWSE